MAPLTEDAEKALRWADAHVDVFERMLNEPESEHEVPTPRGGMLVAHVVGIVGLLSTRLGGHWPTRLSKCRVRNHVRALRAEK